MTIKQSPLARKIYQYVKILQEFRNFENTRNAIINGEELATYDYPTLEEKGFIRPWQFKTQEIIYSLLPSIITINVLTFFYGDPVNNDNITERTTILISEFGTIISFLNTFTIPVITTLVAYLVGWGCIRKKDFNPILKEKAIKSYLYYSGSYCLLSETLIVLCLSLGLWAIQRPTWINSAPVVVNVIYGALFHIPAIILAYLIFIKIPKRLFKTLGYSTRVKHFWNESHFDDPPWFKYIFSIYIGSIPLAVLWIAFISSISFCVAFVITELKLLML